MDLQLTGRAEGAYATLGRIPVQIYFLSVITTILSGAVLASGTLGERFGFLKSLGDFFAQRGPKLALGAFTGLVGFFKFLVYATPGQVPFLGDFLPAVAGLSLGAYLLLEYYSGASDMAEGTSKSLQLLSEYKAPAGIAALSIGALHFLFPAAILL